ncbi:MAG: hypothetical protein ACHQO8_02645 [Vicinamibacterales bacterium]
MSWSPRAAPAVLIVAFLLSLPAVTTRIYASDEVEAFAWLHSWFFDRDVDFQNEYRYFYDAGLVKTVSFHETFLERTNEAGRRFNFAPIGCALLWTPFYAAGHVAALVSGAPADGLGHPYVAAVAYGSAVYGLAALLLSLAIAAQLVGRGVAASVAIWLGTPLLFYMYVAPPMLHACSAFAVSLFVWVWLNVRDGWSVRGVVALGAAAALMAMVREQDVFFALGPAIDFVGWAARGRPAADLRRAVGLGATGAGAFLLAYSPQLLAYRALNGHPWPTDYVTRKMTWTAPHSLQVLFSPEHGLFMWTPLALVAIAGLVWLALGRVRTTAPDIRWIGAIMVLMVALQVYVNGSIESWTVAGSFGQRRFVALTPLLVVGLAAAIVAWSAAGRAARIVAGALVAACIWWNLGLMVQFGLNAMDRQRLTPGANAWTTFVVLPAEAPRIAWRYLTARESFYNLPHQ